MSGSGSSRPPSVRSASGRPTPVRQGVEAPPAVVETPPSARRHDGSDGRSWQVEVAGRGATGRRGEASTGLLLLVFRPDSAEGGDGDAEALEVLVAAGSLDDLSASALDELLDRARPFRSDPAGDQGFFEGTRTRRSGR